MTVQLNGELREVPEGSSLAALIEWLKLPRDRVAVERNLEIVPRPRWNVTPIQAGDQLEVVHLVGGGVQGGLVLGLSKSPSIRLATTSGSAACPAGRLCLPVGRVS